jgi:steroid delta-isomerase
MDPRALDELIAYYERLGPESVGEMERYYAPDCSYRDPFNEVRGLAAIQQVTRRMYRHIRDPRLRVTERVAGEGVALLLWDFDFRMRLWRPKKTHRIHGVTLLRFDAAGKVRVQHDYWDAAGELYEKLPVLGWMLRAARRYIR